MRLRVLSLASLLALVSLAAPALFAQSGTFDVALQGKSVGSASFRITPEEGAFRSITTVRVSTKGIEYALSKTEQLSSTRAFRNADLSAVVNGQAVHLTAVPQDGQLALTIAANGRTTTSRLAAHEAAVLLPDFDPGALETLLALAAARNNRDLWVVIPRNAGSVEQVQLATYADEKGTFDGKPIAVHHLIATCGGATTDLFSGPAHQLLQAELPQQGFALVRKGFVLTPPAKPLAPPPGADDAAPASSSTTPTGPAAQ